MKLAVSMWSLVSEARAGRIDAASFVRYAATIGAEGVELLDVFWRDKEREFSEVQAALRESGLPVSAYAIGNDLVQPDPGERERQIQSIRDGVDMALRLGTQRLRVFSGSQKADVAFDDGAQWIVDGLRAGAVYAAEHHVTLVLENHGLFAGRADQVRGIIEAVNQPSLRANVDTGNFLLVNQDPVVAAQELASVTAYVHLKDFRAVKPHEQVDEAYTGLTGDRYVGTVIGAGEVRLDAVLRALQGAGYDGWLSIEFEGTGDAKRGLEESVRATRTLIQALDR
jgi:sugar phosphate isomerase/epimerase